MILSFTKIQSQITVPANTAHFGIAVFGEKKVLCVLQQYSLHFYWIRSVKNKCIKQFDMYSFEQLECV